MQSDAHETLVERFDEMNEMLNEKVLNEELGDKARTHMNKLQRMFDVYSRRQREVGSVVLLSLWSCQHARAVCARSSRNALSKSTAKQADAQSWPGKHPLQWL